MSRWSWSPWASLILLCTTLVVLTSHGSQAQTNSLFVSPQPSAMAGASSDQTTRLRALEQAPTTAALSLVGVILEVLNNDSFTIPLPDGTVIQVLKRSVEYHSPTNFTWTGDIVGTGGQIVLVVLDGELTGQIMNGTNIYTITPLGNGTHAVIKRDPSGFPPEHGNTQPPLTPGRTAYDPSLSGTEATATSPVQVDVLVVYTPSARAAAGGTSNMVALIQQAIAISNTAYSNSNALVTWRLVGTEEVNYTENTNGGNDRFTNALNAVTGKDRNNNPVTQIPGVAALRDQLGADEVALLINDNSSCGLAWVNSDATTAFSVTHYDCASPNFSLAHEIGHNFGALHDPFVDPSNTPFAYGHGYVFGANASGWRTIMGYADACGGLCPRVQYFSNPSNLYQGNPMGTAAVSDVARVHRERVLTVAAFRAEVGGTSSIVSSVLPQARTTFFPGGPAVTAFASIINSGSATATACSIALPSGVSATLHYQTTNASNVPTGTQDTAVDIPAGGTQGFVFSVTPTATFSQDIQLVFDCTNTAPAPVMSGVNTFAVTVSSSSIPDMLSIADTTTHNGITIIPGTTGTGFMVTAATNIGAAGTVTCMPTPTPVGQAPRTIAADLSICQTNAQGTCTNPATPTSQVTLTAAQNQISTYSVFMRGQGQTIPFDPANMRVFFLCTQGANTVGEASVAVRTPE